MNEPISEVIRPRRRTKRALQRKQVLVEKYVVEGMSRADAEARAQTEMRDNEKGDWRRG